MRQPNIEIYVRCDLGKLTDWIDAIAGPITSREELGVRLYYETRLGTVVLTPGMEDGPFVSAYFGPSTPWDTDVDCARQAAHEIGCIVRCDPGPQFPDVHPASDIWLEMDRGGERFVVWCGDEDEGDEDRESSPSRK